MNKEKYFVKKFFKLRTPTVYYTTERNQRSFYVDTANKYIVTDYYVDTANKFILRDYIKKSSYTYTLQGTPNKDNVAEDNKVTNVVYNVTQNIQIDYYQVV